jgi:NTE family protein
MACGSAMKRRVRSEVESYRMMLLNAWPGIRVRRYVPSAAVILSLSWSLTFLLFISTRTSADSTQASGRAVVLGGGGPVGEAWESGVILGLHDKGIDLSRADLIIGTSAGAIVGARLAGKMATVEFIQAALEPADAPPPGQPVSAAPSGPPPDLSFLADKLHEMAGGKGDPQSIRAEIGRWATQVHPVVSESDFVASYKRRFPKREWPTHAYECVSVDASDGSIRVWNESSGLSLADAVASSCALPGVFAPVAIDGRRYMDGGVRSVTNADLARGCKTAVTLAPTAGLSDPLAKDFTAHLDNELRALRDSGCEVELITPDAASLKAFGPSIGDERHRAPPFDAGRLEGQAKATSIAKLWNH